jgi:hypothetical protein
MTNHPNRSRSTAELIGYYREDSGTLVRARLYLRRDAHGWYDPAMQLPGLPMVYVTAGKYLITPDMTGAEINGCGGAPFLPDDGQCERIGLEITDLADTTSTPN